MAGIRLDASQIIEALETTETKAQVAIKMYAQQGATKMQNYAKVNRPWTDRTGRARLSLVGFVETFKDKTRIYISHGVSYGIYLELAHEKRFAILQKTVNAVSPEILEGFTDLIKRLR